MKYITIASSFLEPVTLAEMRSQLGITSADDTSRDDPISRSISVARSWTESFTQAAVISQTRRQYYDQFPDCFEVYAPLQSVVEISYLDTSGIRHILPSENYIVDGVSAQVLPGYQFTWPDARKQVNAVSIEYVCGYVSPEDTPQLYKQAIIIVVSHWEKYFDLTESNSYIGRIPRVAEDLIADYKKFWS